MTIQKTIAANHPTGKPIFIFNLRNKNGTHVTLSNYGNIVTSFVVRGVNIVLGFDDINQYLSSTYLSSYPFFGAVIGRTANRIKDGLFFIDGESYRVAQNNGPHHLHGGGEGFDKKVWEINEEESIAESTVCLEYLSPDGEEGYPGNLRVKQVYRLTDDDELVIESTAVTDKPTIVNLTHHDYFNLNGGGLINNHTLTIPADLYLGQDENLAADGVLLKTENSVYDFRKGRILSEYTDYDQSFLINGFDHSLRLAAEATGDKTGIKLQVFTTEPVVHLYTGGGIPELTINGINRFGAFSGFCFETQKEPNAVNIPHFSNTVLRPGEIYREKTVYKVL